MKMKNNSRAGSRLDQHQKEAKSPSLETYKVFVGREIRLLQRQIVSVSARFPKNKRKEVGNSMLDHASALRMQLTIGLEKACNGELLLELKGAQERLCELSQLVYWAVDMGCLAWDSMKAMEVRVASIALALASMEMMISDHSVRSERGVRTTVGGSRQQQ